jgi:hypothetical protein
MENTSALPSSRFVNRSNPGVVVTVLHVGQYRLAELKAPVIIYQRGSDIYVRLTSEFHTKFKPYEES